jgi:hypothetical protein
VLVTTVEIAPGFSRPIKLRRGDSANEKALDFCKQFYLSADVAAPLARHLQENLEKATVFSSVVCISLCPQHILESHEFSIVCVQAFSSSWWLPRGANNACKCRAKPVSLRQHSRAHLGHRESRVEVQPCTALQTGSRNCAMSGQTNQLCLIGCTLWRNTEGRRRRGN